MCLKCSFQFGGKYLSLLKFCTFDPFVPFLSMNLLSTEKQKDVMKHIASFFFFDNLKNIRSRSGRIRQGSSIVAAHDVT